MNRKKEAILILLFFVLSLFVVGCGGGESDNTSDGDNESSGDEDSITDLDGDLDSDADTVTELDIDPDYEAEEDNTEFVESEEEHPEFVDCQALYGEGWAFNPSATSGDGCKDCSNKVCPEESSTGIYYLTSLKGRCICETIEGYFYSDTTYVTMPCDKDNDGWTTITAREFIEHEDPALRDNARCDLRHISAIDFLADYEDAEWRSVTVDNLPLYEPDNRDDEGLLQNDENQAPAYGENGRRLYASELNSFTKACVSSQADYNGNGVADVAEWPGHESIDEKMLELAPYAYFIELYKGAYNPENSHYEIVENDRKKTPDEGMQPVPMVGANHAYWRQCVRKTDSDYDPEKPTIGMDFAQVQGMHHHSLFKCVEIVQQADINEDEPQKISMTQAEDDYFFSNCDVTETNFSDGDEDIEISESDSEDELEDVPVANPSYPEIICEKNDNLVTGNVGFGIVAYKNYINQEDYVRGCVNECVEAIYPVEECSGYPDAADCDVLTNKFGKGSCGCIGNWTGDDCDQCLDNWSLSSGCTECEGNWSLQSGCTECLPNFTKESSCVDCVTDPNLGYWMGSNCDVCYLLFDPQTNCTECYDDDVHGHFDGDMCTQCKTNYNPKLGCLPCLGNFDEDADCLECLDNDTDGHWSGSNCDVCKDNYYTGGFNSGNLVVNPNGISGSTGWNPDDNTIVRDVVYGGENAVEISYDGAGNGTSAYAIQRIDIAPYISKISNGSFRNVTIEMSTKMAVMPGMTGNVVFFYTDKRGVNVYQWKNQVTSSALSTVLPNILNITTTELFNIRSAYVVFTVNYVPFGTARAYFREVKVKISQASGETEECRICDDGWTDDDPDDEEPNCLKCPGDTMDTSHWDANADCTRCIDDNLNGHWAEPDCTECKLFWSGPFCNLCGTDFKKDNDDQCSLSVNLVDNGDAETSSTSMWDSNFTKDIIHQSVEQISSAYQGNYFYCFHNVGGENNPYLEQRIVLSDEVRNLVADGRVGYIVYSAALARKNDNDTARVKIFQASTEDGNGTICSKQLAATGENWSVKSGTCQINKSTRSIRVRLLVDNDEGGEANGFFDDIRLFLTSEYYDEALY